jgi:asparagine synthase (glutamine-hydrolysing)
VHDSLSLAVERRLQIADVPVGVLLSGGLDSSLLVALLAESGVKGLKTFTVGFEDQPEEKGSEFEYSDPVAERYATEHFRFHVPNRRCSRACPRPWTTWPNPWWARTRWPSTCWPSRSPGT